jgi:hypothetical protein
MKNKLDFWVTKTRKGNKYIVSNEKSFNQLYSFVRQSILTKETQSILKNCYKKRLKYCFNCCAIDFETNEIKAQRKCLNEIKTKWFSEVI